MNQRDADHMGQDEDAALMLAFQKGDEEAFVKLYTRYRDRMVNFTRRLLGNVARGEEAAQDVFLKLYKARDRYKSTSRFSTFIFRIATNHCLNMLSRHDTKLTDRNLVAEDHAVSKSMQDATVERAELRRALSAALDKLPEKQRAALVLCHYQDMSYREAAEVIDVSVSSIRSLIHRARNTMMRELGPLLDSEASHAV